MLSKHRLACIGFLTATCVIAPASVAQGGYPMKPIRIIAPVQPGGGVDLVARQVGERLSRAQGQPVVVENQSGGGIVGSQATARAAPADMEATGQRGADLIVNAVGGSVFAEDIRALAFEGRLATVGYVDSVLHADLDLAALHAKRLTLFGVSNKLRSKEQRAAAIPRFVAEVMPHFASGRIKPQIDEVFDFARLKGARARMEASGHVGKIVLRMPATS